MRQNCFNAADSRAGALFLDDFERPELARRSGVRSPADFLGKIADGVRLDALAVLAFE